MTKLNVLFLAILLAFLSLCTIEAVAQSNSTSSDVATTSDKSSSQSGGTTGNSLDSTSADASSPAAAPGTITTNEPSASQATPTTTTTATQPPPTPTTNTIPTTTSPPAPSATTSQPPQTTPNTPAPSTTTNSAYQTTPSSTVTLSSGASFFMPSSSMVFSMSSSVVLSASGSAVSSGAPIPTLTTTVCSANNATCPTGQFCNAANQTCSAVLSDGSACTSGDMCASGVCSNSVCSQSSSSNTSTGTIVGIALGGTAGVGMAAALFFCIRRRRQRINRMRGFTPSMALNGHLNDKNFGSFRKMANSDRHRSDYSFTSEQAALESLSSMSMSMSPIARQSAIYYKNNQMHNLSGTSSPFEDNDTYQTMSVSSTQPLAPPAPPAMQKTGVRSSKFDFLQSAFANRKTMMDKPSVETQHTERSWASPALSEVSSARTSRVTMPEDTNWQALTSQPPSRAGFARSERTASGSNRMSTTTFGSGHHHVAIGDDESVADPNYSPSFSHTSTRMVLPGNEIVSMQQSHNPFRTTYKSPDAPRDAWSKEDEDGMNAYQYF
ncbi:hypothetical protein Unana1_05285 [Umbelopsis nana]